MEYFTPSGYVKLVEFALGRSFRFIALDDPSRFDAGRFCIMSHDVDADPEAALKMAEIEARLGVRSTYFIMLRSPLYNAFGRANHRIFARIAELGHWIGLHYDQGFRSESDVDANVAFEIDIFERNFNVPVRVVSFHQPSPEVISGKVSLKGFMNTWARDQMPGFEYLSDTNKRWRALTPVELLTSKDKVYFSFHPLWWFEEDAALSAEELWNRAILRNFRRSQQQLLDTERAYGKERELRLIAAPPGGMS